jgi:adenine-specific DNA-methyltransferase
VLFYFLARASQLSRGEVAMIISRSMLEGHKARPLRKYLAQNLRLREIVDFQHAQVFPGVGINTAIVRLTKGRRSGDAVVRRLVPKALPPGTDVRALKSNAMFETLRVPQSRVGADAWNYADADVHQLLQTMDQGGTPVGNLLAIGQGMQTGRNDAFTVPGDLVGAIQSFGGFVLQRARNSDIGAYELRDSGVWMIYPERATSLAKLPSDLRRHIQAHRVVLEARAAFRRGNCEWWRYTWPLHRENIDRSRLLCPYMAKDNRFALDRRAERLGLTDTTVLYANDQPEDLRYVMGYLNSSALTLRFRYIGKLKGGGVYEYFENTVRQLPVVRAQPGTAAHDDLVDLVQTRIDLGNERRGATTSDLEEIEKEIYDVTGLIDNHVAASFGLDPALIGSLLATSLPEAAR